MQKNTQFLFILCALVSIVSFLLCRRIASQADINILHDENPESCTYTVVFPVGRSAAVTACLARELANSRAMFKNKVRLKDGAILSIWLDPGKLSVSAKKGENNKAAFAHIHSLYGAVAQVLGQ